MTCFCSERPGAEDGVGVFGFPVQDKRTACDKYHNERFARCLEGTEQILLRIGDGNVGTAGTLTIHVVDFAYTGHHNIALTGDSHGIGNEAALRCGMDGRKFHIRHKCLVKTVFDSIFLHGIVEEPGAFGITHRATLDGFFDTLANGHGIVGKFASGCSPASQHVGSIVGKWANNGDTGILL